MKHVELKVEGMSCQHCVKAIHGALDDAEGIEHVEVALDKGSVSVDYQEDKITVDNIKDKIEDEGYGVVA